MTSRKFWEFLTPPSPSVTLKLLFNLQLYSDCHKRVKELRDVIYECSLTKNIALTFFTFLFFLQKMFEDDSFSDLSVSCSAPVPPPLPPRLVRQPPIRRISPNLNRSDFRHSNRNTTQTTARQVTLSSVEALSRRLVYFEKKYILVSNINTVEG